MTLLLGQAIRHEMLEVSFCNHSVSAFSTLGYKTFHAQLKEHEICNLHKYQLQTKENRICSSGFSDVRQTCNARPSLHG